MAGSTSSTSPTTSPSTFSFSTSATSSSHYTSEEQPDLGAGFRTVLREWTYLQPPPRIPTYIHHYSPSQNETLQSQTQDGRRSTVWAYEPIAQYLEDDRETETDTDTMRSVQIETETEIDPSASSTASPMVSASVVDDYTLTLRTQPSPPASGSLDFDFEHNHTHLGCQQEKECGPSLGYLDQALSFIAAERAQLAARTSLSQPDAWRHVVGPPSTAVRRKRRRRKHKSPSLSKVSIEDDTDTGGSYHAAGLEDSDDDAEGDDEQSPYYHSILKYQSKSTPLTPRPRSPTSPTSPTSTLTPSFPLSLPIKAETCNAFSSSDSPHTSHASGESKRPARRRTRAKSRKPSVPSSSSLVFPSPSHHTHTLTHARSVPSLRFLARHREGMSDFGLVSGDSTVVVTDLEGVDDPTRKLIALTRYLVKISPAEREVLEGVERKMVVQALRRLRAGVSDASPNSDVRISGFREEREKNGSEGSEERGEEHGDGEDVLDPRGRAPREGDPPVHVFIDHSNILFGLLTYLKRHPYLTTSANFNQTLRNRNNDMNNGQDSTNDNAKLQSRVNFDVLDTTATTEKAAMALKEEKEKEVVVPRILTRPHATTITSTSMNTMNKAIPISPVLTNLTSTLKASSVSVPTTSTQTQAQAQIYMHTTPIPLPSFATALSRNTMSNPSTSAAKLDSPYVRHSKNAGTDTTGTDTTPTSTSPISPMKTRTRSRSRKVRKAAQTQTQRVMSREDDCEHDVVLFGGRTSLRHVGGEGRHNYRHESMIATGHGYGERDEETDVETDVEWQEDCGKPDVEAEGRGTGIGTGQSRSGGGAQSHDQVEGASDREDRAEASDEKVEAQARIKKGTGARTSKTSQKQRHLSHTALALILERGRAVSRRVVVTSSPLYQPMDTLERLGYEVRVYIRVPDLGDGMDRAVKKKSYSHKPHLSGGTTSGGDGSGAGLGSPGTSPLKPGLSSFTQQQSAYPTLTPPTTPVTSATPARVRYREQGVDELLQLKLHQVLAATDDVPPGATIVLATGDGNVGQFSEDGFLGPVRTALKRGWRVELYAWEEGLSRAWRREFGLESEWARKGMFQIIGLEQFAANLIKGGL